MEMAREMVMVMDGVDDGRGRGGLGCAILSLKLRVSALELLSSYRTFPPHKHDLQNEESEAPVWDIDCALTGQRGFIMCL